MGILLERMDDAGRSLAVLSGTEGKAVITRALFEDKRATALKGHENFPHRSILPSESARGLAQSKTLARSPVAHEWREASWTAVALHRFSAEGSTTFKRH